MKNAKNKKSIFDELYYILFFADCIEIFNINSNDINEKIKYGDKQHRGNKGEGQFHITNKTYKIHKDNFFNNKLSYGFVMNKIENVKYEGSNK